MKTAFRCWVFPLALAGLTGCDGGDGAPGVRVVDAWARPAPVEEGTESVLPGATTAVYLTLLNRSGTPLRLLGGESPAAGRVEIHESALQGDVVRMRRVEGMDILPGERMTLAPGGVHLMLLDLTRSLAVGDTLSLTLTFRTHPPLPLRVPVRGVFQEE